MTRHIRPLESGDAARLAELMQRNREFLEPWEPVRPESYFTVEGQVEAVADSRRRAAEGTMAPYVIIDEAGSVVGRINLNNIVRGPFQSASVGYWLDEAAGGRGLATAAVAELVGVAFETLGLHRVEAGTVPENERSQAVLRRNGFKRFGYAPGYLAIAGSYRDHILFQRLADD
ncbi:MAG: GNAT family N-acetyltransferase [Propionibacteriaceae bacterium]|nr:GNAT family N-acetyltransferase [Propionibacteriaceae bacterium]